MRNIEGFIIIYFVNYFLNNKGSLAFSRPLIAEMPIARIASSVLPPICGVTKTLLILVAVLKNL